MYWRKHWNRLIATAIDTIWPKSIVSRESCYSCHQSGNIRVPERSDV